MDFSSILVEIRRMSSQKLDINGKRDFTTFVANKLVHISQDLKSHKESFNEILLECLKHLKLMCTQGSSFQDLIIDTSGMLETLKDILASGSLIDCHLRCFQLVANLCVQNARNQKIVWESMSGLIVDKLKGNDSLVNVSAMIIYNINFSGSFSVSLEEMTTVVKICLSHYQQLTEDPSRTLPDFLHILMDYLISKSSTGLEVYKQLNQANQKVFLTYVNDFVEDSEREEILNQALLLHFTIEFKKKSDCILKTVPDYVEKADPQVIVLLLEIISTVSTQRKYVELLCDDRSLFLNLGCLLQVLIKHGKASSSTFSPLQSLDELAPSSSANSDFEREISYSFKTNLVKSLANLAHRNKKNQELAREMEIMLSIFECTNADARNPLIREWSVLAIRNLCEDNLDNQEIVRGLTKVGDAENPMLKEFGLQSGMLRIGKQ